MKIDEKLMEDLSGLGYDGLENPYDIIDFLEKNYKIYVWIIPPVRKSNYWIVNVGEYIMGEMSIISYDHNFSKSKVVLYGIQTAVNTIRERELFKEEWID